MFQVQNNADWSTMMAASTIALIPSIIFLVFMQKYIVQGLTAVSYTHLKPVTDYRVSDFDSSVSGEKTVTVTYEDCTAEFTVIPVLSEQMTVAQPSVSTACNFLITAPFFRIFPTASARAMVTMAGSPSGTAATASDRPVTSMENTGSPRRIPVTATTAQITRQPIPIYLPSSLKRR